jgi:uncharacterized protein (DUF433 family)
MPGPNSAPPRTPRPIDRNRPVRADRTLAGLGLAETVPGTSVPQQSRASRYGTRLGRDRWAYTQGVSRLDRITSDPEVCHGKPVIRGLRYPVSDILQLLAGGMTVDEVLADYPDLERDDVLAALEYGALAAGNRRIPLAG